MYSISGATIKPAVILIILLSLAGPGWAKDKVHIAYFHALPYVMYEPSTKTVSGSIVDLLEYIGPEMGVEFVWDTTPSNIPRQLRLLMNEHIDASAIMIHTPDRALKYSYTQIPYNYSRPVIGVKISNSLSQVRAIEDILPLKIGYASKTYISPFMRDKRINWEFLHSGSANGENLRKLLLGRIDAIYIPDKVGLLAEISQLGILDSIRVLELPEPADRMHVVFSKNNKALADRYDKAYFKIGGDEVYLKILSKYLDISKL